MEYLNDLIRRNSITFLLFLLIFNVFVNIGAQPIDSDKPNVLYIITDQQRFDALRFVQNELDIYDGKLKIRTPNLDRLAAQGAYFRNAYTPVAVCGPARACLRTGLTTERNGMQTNDLHKVEYHTREPNLFQDKVESAVSLDQILVEDRGYVSEYYGKWHLPDRFYQNKAGTADVITYNHYDYETGTFSLKKGTAWSALYKDYLNYFDQRGNINKIYPEGAQTNTYSGYPYVPVQYDSRYGYPTNTHISQVEDRGQPFVMGMDLLPENATPSGTNGYVGVQSLGRLCQQSKPFILTLSFHNPHAPMVVTEKYFDYYYDNRDNLLLPPNLLSNLENSGYNAGERQDPEKVKEWTACYYGLVEEIDFWVGELLDTLSKYPEVEENTIILFTSDHGEMLGAHGLKEKNIFLEESAHVPLLFKIPGKIQPGTVVDESISILDIFPTILDYANADAFDDSDGTSLRSFIDKTSYNKDYDEDHMVTEWDYRDPNGTGLTRTLGGEMNFLSRKGAYKLIMTKLSTSNKKDMLYDISNDPFEMNNLIGDNGPTASDFVVGKTEHLKALLIDWMLRLDGVEKNYTDPKWNNYQGLGDVEEIRRRRTWKTMDLWVGDTAVCFGSSVDVNGTFTRNEWLYLGRSNSGTTNITGITVEGDDAGAFSVSEFTSGPISQNEHRKVKIQYTSASDNVQINDAVLRISYDAGEDILVKLCDSKPKVSSFILDSCNLTNGWSSSNSVTLNFEDQKEGSGSIEISSSGVVDFEKTYATVFDSDVSEVDGRMTFWFYVSDIDLLDAQTQVQLGSGGLADTDIYSWLIDKTTFTDGWNYISLNFSDGTKTGAPILNAINWFSLSTNATGSVTSRLDKICLVEGDLPLPTKAGIVFPSNNFVGVGLNTILNWIPGKDAKMYDVYFGTTNPPLNKVSVAVNSFDPGTLNVDQTYYWRVDSKNASGSTEGDVWSFVSIGLPSKAENPMPPDNSTGASTNIDLRWTSGALAKSHDVYFGTTNPPVFVKNEVENTHVLDAELEFETTYYWRIDEVNEIGTTEGAIWSFTTRAANSSAITLLSNADQAGDWAGVNFQGVITSGNIQGDGALQAIGTANNDFQIVFDPPINCGVALADAQLVFWYYVDDVTKLNNNNQVEIGSGGKSDTDEYAWAIDKADLENGWNLIQLNFSDASKIGNPNLFAIDWFRLYRAKSNEVTSYIDNIRIIDTSIPIPLPEIVENESPLNGSSNIAVNPKLTWTPGEHFEYHKVYFGTTDPPEFIGEQPGNEYTPEFQLDSSITYYWRVDEVNLSGTTQGTVWSFTVGASVSNGITVLSDGDEAGDWGGVNFDGVITSGNKQGEGALQAIGSATNDFQIVFDPPINSSASESNAQLVFWYYIDDTSKLENNNQVEIGSGGAADTNEYAWQINKEDLQNGWNLIQLDFSDANKLDNPTLASINWFRLYRGKSGEVTSYIDNVRIIDTTIPIPLPKAAEGETPLNGSVNVSTVPVLTWTPGQNFEYHNLYFGTTNPPAYIGEQPGNDFTPAFDLDSATTYYWRVDQVNLSGTTEGAIWSFTTHDLTLGLESVVNKNVIKISPNPSRGMVHLEMSVLDRPTTVRVLDLTGRLVYKSVVNNIKSDLDLRLLPKGSYLLELRALKGSDVSIIILD